MIYYTLLLTFEKRNKIYLFIVIQYINLKCNWFIKQFLQIHLIELNESVKILYTDTLLIINNLGIDMIAYNLQLKKHKTT